MKISQQLIKDCSQGDRRGQFQLYKSCFNVLMSVCIRYHNSEEEAAAVLNIGFLKILNNLGKYRKEVPFEAWIRRIMINVIIDEFRKHRKVKELIEHTDFKEYDNHTDLVNYNLADQLFDAEALEDFIKKLPPVSQKVFNLYAIDGYKHKEIAKLLEVSEGTSKWHLSFARKRIQEMMKQAINAAKVI